MTQTKKINGLWFRANMANAAGAIWVSEDGESWETVDFQVGDARHDWREVARLYRSGSTGMRGSTTINNSGLNAFRIGRP